ncbi:rhomboid family intramembrane serine protease [Horticoccus sp. 23ND18S-11]|uniref:rhomboid family intramembrane serine protease n=1 Tax=Horticoccus sp. 23ND18S-11 TaxID=3391832 RepID=UPI0039C94B7D
MEPTTPGVTGESTFTVNFNARGSGHYNRDLRGRGVLVIRDAEPRFVFRGKERGRFSIGGTVVEMAIRTDAISNVTREDTTVGFASTVGKTGRDQARFVFSCANEAEAVFVFDQLPATQDEDFIAGESFIERLHRQPDTGEGLKSVTNLILLANLSVFVVMGFLGAGWFEVASMTPYMRFGANNAAATTDGEWWRLVTCMFMHFGLLHLLLNAWALFQAGHLVERLFGRVLYLIVYLGSGIVGSVATLLWNGDKVWSAGASGAVFGVYGALLGYLWREKHGVPKGVFRPILKSTLVFAGYNLFYGAVHPNIDNAAHLGGLLGGVALGWICALPLDVETRRRLRGRRAAWALAATGVAWAAGVIYAPRFAYRVGEELAWSREIGGLIDREPAIVQGENAAINAYAKNRDATALARWLNDEGIRFYDGWLARLAQLSLTPGRETALRRDALQGVITLKVAAYRRLERDLDAGAPEALRHFLQTRKEISAATRPAEPSK